MHGSVWQRRAYGGEDQGAEREGWEDSAVDEWIDGQSLFLHPVLMVALRPLSDRALWLGGLGCDRLLASIPVYDVVILLAIPARRDKTHLLAASGAEPFFCARVFHFLHSHFSRSIISVLFSFS